MDTSIRPFADGDVEAVVALALRAWEPVYASLAEALGDDLDQRLTPDWRTTQERAVRTACENVDGEVWVAEIGDEVAGFLSLSIFDADRLIGEIDMLAVDPDHQLSGLGRALAEHGIATLREWGMRVALVETGGDPGHTPARRVYEHAEFVRLPITRYFKAL